MNAGLLLVAPALDISEHRWAGLSREQQAQARSPQTILLLSCLLCLRALPLLLCPQRCAPTYRQGLCQQGSALFLCLTYNYL